jgi:signal transduction histidine kinase
MENRSLDVEVVGNLYKEGKKRVAQFNIRDITERKRFSQKLQQTARLESLGILAGGIAHDFNNLLSGILGNAGLALSDAPAGSPYQSALKDVVRASQRAADLTRQMLAYSGRGRFVVRPLNLSELVLEVSKLVRSSLPTSVELKFDLADHLPSVEADSVQIQQVVMNLVINAAEAIGEGNKGLVRITTKLQQLDAKYLRQNFPGHALNPGSYVVLEVSDSGCGMDENTLAKIFDPFFTTKFTGRGLGLASVQGIVRAHHGGLCLESAVGRGTTFTVLFPSVQAPATNSTVGPKPEDLRGTGTVLVVDDEQMALTTMQSILERNGYQVRTATNGEIAVNIVREHKNELALVILDLAMPDMGGDKAFVQITALAPDLPILLTSGYDAMEVIGKLGSDAPAGFIQSPPP